jgi:hypothetical protein
MERAVGHEERTMTRKSARLERLTQPTPPHPEWKSALHRGYFAQLGQAWVGHSRWIRGITSQDLVEHVERASPAGIPENAASSWAADVALAVACCRDLPEAWGHLVVANTWRLREACALRLDAEESILFTERFWSDLRTRTRAAMRDPESGARGGALRLQCYSGQRALARWLVAHLLVRLESGVGVPSGSLDSSPAAHTLIDSTAGASLRLPTAT